MRSYSMDLRERVAATVDEGSLSQRKIARLFRVSLSFVSRLLKRRREAGTLDPEPHRGGPRPALSFVERWRLRRMAQEHNDDTLDELRRRCGFTCSLTTIWRALRRHGLTRKKKSMHADERDRPDVKRKRRSFRWRVGRIEPGRLQFLDESGANTAMARAYARAPRGERAVGSAPGKWESFTVVAALGLDGVRAPLVIPGAMDAAAFESYVADVLAPQLRPGDVVVWDRVPTTAVNNSGQLKSPPLFLEWLLMCLQDPVYRAMGPLPDLLLRRLLLLGAPSSLLKNPVEIETLASPPGIIVALRGGGPSSFARGRDLGRRETCPARSGR